MKMDSKKMKTELETRLSRPERKIIFNREQDSLRIENSESGKGITVALPGIIAKWHEKGQTAIDEVVYYVEEGLGAMDLKTPLKEQEKKIFPVIRSTSFPREAEEGVPFLIDEHTAETNILYAVDMGKTYRLIDTNVLKREGWTEERVRETARFNVRSLSTDLKLDTVAGNKFYFLNKNDGYDASRILNKAFLDEMAGKITGVMTVAVPHQDVLIIGDIVNDTGYDVLAQMTMSFFASGRVPITALSFLYENGELEPIFIMGKNRKRNKDKEE